MPYALRAAAPSAKTIGASGDEERVTRGSSEGGLTLVPRSLRVGSSRALAGCREQTDGRERNVKRYEAPVVIATYAAKDLRSEAALVAVASIQPED